MFMFMVNSFLTDSARETKFFPSPVLSVHCFKSLPSEGELGIRQVFEFIEEIVW